jgi:hypothetical protein
MLITATIAARSEQIPKADTGQLYTIAHESLRGHFFQRDQHAANFLCTVKDINRCMKKQCTYRFGQ